MTSKESEYYNLSIRFDEIEKVIVRKLKSFSISEELYETYRQKAVSYCKSQDNELERTRRALQIQLNSVRSENKRYIEKYM